MKSYVLGAGLHGLILGDMFKSPVIGKLDGQSSCPFPLGPRILHYDKYAAKYLKSMGIDKEPGHFFIGHFEGSLLSGNTVVPDEAYKVRYNLKVRGMARAQTSAMSSDKNCIYGWDLKEVGLYDKLLDRVEIINNKVTAIDTHNEELLLDNGELFEYRRLYNTMKLTLFTDLLNKKYQVNDLKAAPVQFMICKSSKLSKILGYRDYMYFNSVAVPFNRITRLKADMLCLEIPFNINKNSLCELIEVDKVIDCYVVNECQIISPIMNVKMIGHVEMVGRYARWNQSILLNDTIKRGYGIQDV